MHIRRRDIHLACWAFAPAVGVGVIVGIVSGHDQFGWEPAAVAGTGVATAMLAFFTARLAASTVAEVDAARQLADIKRERFAREDEPDVVEGRETLQAFGVAVEIVNLGRGPARDVMWKTYFTLPAGEGEIQSPHVAGGNAGAILGGQSVEVDFSRWVSTTSVGRHGVRGAYSGRDGRGVRKFGKTPLEGWEAWLDEQAKDPAWRLSGRLR